MSNLNSDMKKFGRNVARAKNQSGGKGYRDGGMVSVPRAKMPLNNPGKARGTGAATKGKKFGGWT